MCDIVKYNKIYEEINLLTTEDTLQLITTAKTKEIKEFYIMVSNYLLQKKQKQVIERNLF